MIVILPLLQPELDIELFVNEPLLTEAQLDDSNLMSVTVESLFSPPESFNLGASQYIYTSALPVPLAGEVNLVGTIFWKKILSLETESVSFKLPWEPYMSFSMLKITKWT